MNKASNPKTVATPLGAYSHTVAVPASASWLVISGQVGLDVKGKLQPGIRKQAEQVFRNILACLKDGGMAKKDLVKFTVFLTDSRHIADYRAARKKVIGDATVPASTLLIVNGLASPDILIEIEATAAKG
ncbi:MAG: RidA family protein [Alphaproteobacteria bacterium]|jgi:2-iminobutanoate/2-iminopropanoate deaminase|nr:RidA family protein [Alphaproteobacteria bacterium]MBT4083996.1 RidA family protein [Alphaproteobacteria bacterium]MBT4546480.1 RidA family protein [Alphaproteobacteria bacterium]MBT5916877.1 RidA family protein [Alphaproteobacteria bacterium]MBT6385669.1 RidA family protein [Alphaproteobacteria bacterium]